MDRTASTITLNLTGVTLVALPFIYCMTTSTTLQVLMHEFQMGVILCMLLGACCIVCGCKSARAEDPRPRADEDTCASKAMDSDD